MASLTKALRRLLGRTDDLQRPQLSAGLDKQSTIEVPTAISLGVAQQYFYQEMFPPAAEAPPITTPQKLVMQVLQESLKQPAYLMRAIPRLPEVIPRLIRTLHNSKASAKDFVIIIKKDPSVTAGVLKLVNTAYFNPSDTRITDIERAVVTLGIEGLRRVLSTVVLQPIIQKRSPYFSQFGQKLWHHSLGCAISCEALARQRGLEPYHGYLLGLAHDIGKITLLNELCQQLQQHDPDGLPSRQLVIPLLKEWSLPLSFAIAKNWQLPDEVISALKQQINIKPGDSVNAYGQLLFQANLACEAYYAQRQNPEDFKYLDRRLSEEWELPSELFNALEELHEII